MSDESAYAPHDAIGATTGASRIIVGGKRSKPVFFDTEHRRWGVVRAVCVVFSGVAMLLLTSLVVRIVATPVLPALGLVPGTSARTTTARVVRPLKDTPATTQDRPRAQQRAVAAAAITPVTGGAGGADAATATRYAFFVNWDEMSFVSLKDNIDRLDGIFPEWLHLAGADGALDEDLPKMRDNVLDLVRARRPSLRIMPTIDNWNDGDMSVAPLIACLRSETASAALIERVARYLSDLDCAGICVAFTGMPPDTYPAYVDFLRRLGTRLHADGRLVAVSAPADDAAFPYAACGGTCDLVVVTLMDEHVGKAGPIASRPWFDRVLRDRVATVPHDKLIVGVGNYAYDWATDVPLARLSFEGSMLLARKGGSAITYDSESDNATFTYADDAGRQHRVWMTDAVAGVDEIAAARAAGTAGIALWRLGMEDAGLWPVFAGDTRVDATTASALHDVSFHYQVAYEGEGEVTAVTSSPAPGVRDVSFTDGAVRASRIADLPTPYTVTRYGAAGKMVALTFDDGPDAEWTPKVLDVLRAKQVTATFFTIGRNARDHQDLVRRIDAEGHDLGNHSYTHPLLSRIGAAQVKVEVTATERVIESATDRRTVLFRQPYVEDVEARSMEEVERLRVLADLGYITVGANVDSEDWRRLGAEAIASTVIDQVTSGNGHIVLMHDSGGERSQTLAALPTIIDQLRERGYTFVPVSTLIGRTHDEVMPKLQGHDLTAAHLFGAGIGTLGWITSLAAALFAFATILGVLRLGAICVLAVIERRRARNHVAPTYEPAVAVLIPAYNEEKVITKTIDSLLGSEYGGKLEIVVVDDGSKDKTHACVAERYKDEPRVRSFRTSNRGKPDALNYAIGHSQAEVLVALDADTVFQPDTIAKLVRHFGDPQVGAVAGNAKVGNRLNLMTRWQALEYITSQNLDRRAFHLLNCITVVPGAVGAWRRDVVEAIGGFTPDTLAEDADLTMSILERGYRVAYDDEAIAWTEAPETIGQFLKQRYRWMFGTAQAAWKHRKALMRPSYGALGMIALPNIVLFQIIFPLIAPIVDATLLWSMADSAISVWQHAAVGADAAWRVLGYYLLFTVVDLIAGMLAFRYEPGKQKRLLWWLLPQRFLYRQLLYCVAIKATLSALRGREVGWGKLDRSATVSIPKAKPVTATHTAASPAEQPTVAA